MATSHSPSSSSVASYSLQFVIFAVCILVSIAAATGLLIYGVLGNRLRGSLSGVFWGSTGILWLLCVVRLWWHYFRQAKSLNLPSSPGLFVVFHASALVFVLVLSFFAVSLAAEFQKAVDGVRLVYDTALVLFSLAYISFHLGLRRPIAWSVYAGLAMTAVSVWLSFRI